MIRAVPLREWPALLAAAGVALVVEVGLRVTTLPRLARLLGAPLRTDDGGDLMPPSTPARLGPSLTPATRRRLRAVRRVLRHWPFGDTCLRRALVSGHVLRRLRPVLRVGVAKVDGRIQAHAWLEIDGVSLDPAGAELYQTFESIGGAR
ncbi:lasso peptide biosynthesis B2 protein [Jiangella asiatica]|uniref:Lasso peptide biosynthesis B2 protein n=1 Tax=Jiangella asiatica TaxID=2530372 RepID=A0A4V2Z258_9ACTN|nr:lasso peptide biosynthesis B2 protein [Jiangella asiatica]TDE07478.1 lasso peptide biosynthesis B2 protein [Jiangella asiatica]